jgi:hypothetical protein
MHDMGTASVEEHRALIARAETKIAEQAPMAAEAGERAQAKAAGFTERDLRRRLLLASLTEAEMKQASAKTCAEALGATKTAIEREARRIIRARR